MTQYRKDPSAISNHFDKLFSGIGHRGSSFTDSDWTSHDMATNRALVMEFKQETEIINAGQERKLLWQATLPGVTVWAIWKLDNGRYRIRIYPGGKTWDISGKDLKMGYRKWWEGKTGKKATEICNLFICECACHNE